MIRKTFYLLLILVATASLIFLITKKKTTTNNNKVNTSNESKPTHTADMFWPNEYKGKDMYKIFKQDHKGKPYKNIENKCLDKNIITDLCTEFENNMKEIISIQNQKDIPNEREKRKMEFLSYVEKDMVIFGLLIDKYGKCDNRENIEICWNDIVSNSNDDELWFVFFLSLSYWNDKLINEIILKRVDENMQLNFIYWPKYLKNLAIWGTLNTANALDVLAEKNKSIPEKANDYRKCAQMIRDRLNGKLDWDKDMKWSRWWEKQK